MSILLGDINCGLEHQYRVRNSWDPADKTDDVEHSKDGKDNTGAVLMLQKVYNCSSDAKNYLKDTSNPYDLFRKDSDHPEVCKTEDEGRGKNKSTKVA